MALLDMDRRAHGQAECLTWRGAHWEAADLAAAAGFLVAALAAAVALVVVAWACLVGQAEVRWGWAAGGCLQLDWEAGCWEERCCRLLGWQVLAPERELQAAG